MKTVKEIMVSSPKYCKMDEPLQTAIEHMSNSNIGSLPVLDENKKVVGIITDRDICLSLGKEGNRKLSDLRVEDILSNDQVHTLYPEDNLQTALKVMRTKQVGRIPVIDKDRNLKGIVTLGRILRESKGSKNEAELQHAGDENIIKTLHSISASRRKREVVI